MRAHLAALFLFSWQRLVVMAVIYVLAINVGIGMCYHRLLTHRGYQVPKWLEYVMTFFATLSLEGGPIFWVSTHRVHHQLSDKEGDPHTPREGGWWAHAGWVFFGESLHAQTEVLARYTPDLTRDRFHVWMSKYHWLPVTLSAVLLVAGGWYWGGFVNGVAMLMWGVFLRVTSACTPPGWSTRQPICGASAALKPATTRATVGGWLCSPAARAGTTTTTPIPSPRATASAWYEIDPNFYGIWILVQARPRPQDPGRQIRSRQPQARRVVSRRRYFWIFAFTHSTPKNGSATTSTSTAAGKPT